MIQENDDRERFILMRELKYKVSHKVHQILRILSKGMYDVPNGENRIWTVYLRNLILIWAARESC